MAETSPPSEADTLEPIVRPEAGGFAPEAARAILRLAFSRPTTNRLRQLLRKDTQGTISLDDRLTLEKHLRVGQLVDLLHAKARLSLKEMTKSR